MDDLADNPSESRPSEGEAGAENREDYQDPLHGPSGSEVEEEQEEEEEKDGKRVRAAKVKDEYPWPRLTSQGLCSAYPCAGPCLGSPAASVHRAKVVELAGFEVPYR